MDALRDQVFTTFINAREDPKSGSWKFLGPREGARPGVCSRAKEEEEEEDLLPRRFSLSIGRAVARAENLSTGLFLRTVADIICFSVTFFRWSRVDHWRSSRVSFSFFFSYFVPDPLFSDGTQDGTLFRRYKYPDTRSVRITRILEYSNRIHRIIRIFEYSNRIHRIVRILEYSNRIHRIVRILEYSNPIHRIVRILEYRRNLITEIQK